MLVKLWDDVKSNYGTGVLLGIGSIHKRPATPRAPHSATPTVLFVVGLNDKRPDCH